MLLPGSVPKSVLQETSEKVIPPARLIDAEAMTRPSSGGANTTVKSIGSPAPTEIAPGDDTTTGGVLVTSTSIVSVVEPAGTALSVAVISTE